MIMVVCGLFTHAQQLVNGSKVYIMGEDTIPACEVLKYKCDTINTQHNNERYLVEEQIIKKKLHTEKIYYGQAKIVTTTRYTYYFRDGNRQDTIFIKKYSY